MNYSDFQAYCARMGFTQSPLTEDQFDHCVDAGLSEEGIYGVACDVMADVEFNAAVVGNLYQELDNA